MVGNAKTRRSSGEAASRTGQREFWCACPKGHRFVAELFAAVDIDERPEAMELLSDAGLQPARCPECAADLWLAEAFVLHQPSRGKSALFIPDALSHRELELRAEMLRSIAATASQQVPAHAADPEVVVGVAALRRWLFGEAVLSVASVAPVAPVAPDSVVAEAPAKAREIHAAFKDLEDPESPANRPSLPPSGPQMEDVDVNEPLLDDDWLADDTIAPSRQRGASSKRGERSPGETAIVRPGKKRTSGVDFAGLLSDDEGDFLAERPGAKRP